MLVDFSAPGFQALFVEATKNAQLPSHLQGGAGVGRRRMLVVLAREAGKGCISTTGPGALRHRRFWGRGRWPVRRKIVMARDRLLVFFDRLSASAAADRSSLSHVSVALPGPRILKGSAGGLLRLEARPGSPSSPSGLPVFRTSPLVRSFDHPLPPLSNLAVLSCGDRAGSAGPTVIGAGRRLPPSTFLSPISSAAPPLWPANWRPAAPRPCPRVLALVAVATTDLRPTTTSMPQAGWVQSANHRKD
jgi:hypothetical protein